MTITMSTSAGPPMLELPVMSDKSFMHTEKQKPESNGTGSAHGPLSEKPLPSTVPTTITNPSAGPSSPPSPTAASAYPQPHACPSKPSLPAPASNRLLTTHLLAHPDHTAKKAIHTQFPNPNPIIRLARRFKVKHSVIKGMTDHEWKRYEKMAPELKRKAGWKRAGAPAEEEGVEVSELFWKMYLSLMPTVERDPLSGLVPPDLLGSTTTMPLTVISLIPDIMQHYHDVIIRAREEVFLATNYWQPSNSVTTITGSLLELSALVVKENRKKIVVKIMYDRGSLEQIWNSHAPVAKEAWKPLDLPGPDEIPGLELEVINFHRVLLGTFHAKFLIVDRKVALINSNNIQDRPNLELMSHLEGPVVDSFYEIALHSWYNRLSPPLPCMSTPYTPPPGGYLFSHDNPFFDDIEVLKAAKAARLLLRKQTQDTDAETAALLRENAGAPGDRLRDAVKRVVDHQRQNLAEWRPGERFDEAMHDLREMRERFTGGMGQGSRSRPGSRGPSRRGSANEGMFRSLLKGGDKSDQSPLPAVDPSEAPSSPTIAETPIKKSHLPHPDDMTGHITPTGSVELSGPKRGHTTSHVAFAPVFDDEPSDAPRRSMDINVRSQRGMLTIPPSGGAVLAPSPIATGVEGLPPSPASASAMSPHPAAIGAYPQPGVGAGAGAGAAKNANGEVLPPSAMYPGEAQEVDRTTIRDGEGVIGQQQVLVGTDSTPEGMGSKRLYKMSKMFNAAGVLSEAWATVEDSDDLDTFQPHVVHKPHKPVPVAMACRKPHGFPGHHDIRNPQNAAWLAGFRYAKHKVFIQTPTLNARPIVRAVKQACRRGVSVSLLLDLGFNDKGESIPFQGGTNEEVVVRLYKALRAEKKEQYLKVYWYTGKDQVRPLNAVKKQRNCHIKFAAYDDEVLIIGNGNQDSQSWFHSQEVNIMVDSKQIIQEMMDTLLTNQNTIQYGLVDTDGIWRDKEGKTLQDYGATEGGRFKGLSGFIQFAKTI